MHRYSKEKVTETAIETLIKKKGVPSEFRWYPYSISELLDELSYGDFKKINYSIRKNIAYSLQYLEYIDLQLKELILGEVTKKLLWKNYIINSLGIIEAVFHHLLSIRGLLKTSNFGKVKGFRDTSRIIEENGKKYRVVEGKKEIFNEPKEVTKDFHHLVNDVFSNDILTITNDKIILAKSEIDYLKKIRNKVHLQSVNAWDQTDYFTIEEKDYWLVRFVLFRILSDPIFGRENQKIFPELANESIQFISAQQYNYNLNG